MLFLVITRLSPGRGILLPHHLPSPLRPLPVSPYKNLKSLKARCHFQSYPKPFRVIQSLQESAKAFKSLPKPSRVFQSLQESSKAFQSQPKSAKVIQILFYFILFYIYIYLYFKPIIIYYIISLSAWWYQHMDLSAPSASTPSTSMDDIWSYL